MKKILFVLNLIIVSAIFLASTLNASTPVYSDDDNRPVHFDYNNSGDGLTPIEISDLIQGGTLPKTPGLAAIELYQGEGTLTSVFNKAKYYTLTVRSNAGHVMHVTSIVPAMETYVISTTAYPAGVYTITYTNNAGVDIYQAAFSIE
ncbi:hypothetical protein [Dysgonomonas sp. 25]|uniref:hypothetical protein n=1 Tax=Dysgonomonas sp. 25 TaxID=2302933 RepID=UPI0013D25FC2|nr:hypothetical protein [Dysgonomonas sp. 25]NDV68030.1 hypothetical protein [Dysgonomonas sp. 25]